MKPAIQNNTVFFFSEEIHLTGISEFGFSWNDLISGKEIPGSEGARFDLSFEGRVEGPFLQGTIRGTDYLEVRADGKFMLNIRATIVTDDEKRIAVKEDGVLYPGPDGRADIQLNLQFTTHEPEYKWLNNIEGWALAEVDMLRGEVSVNVYTGDFNFVQELAGKR